MLGALVSPRYKLVQPLGRGGMGAVFLTRDELLDRPVALKRTQRWSAGDILRFKREFRAVERLAHENLVRLYELGSDDDGLYYTMEAIDGVDLAEWCRRGDVAERLASVLPQLLDALAFLHAHGVAHCDLKPSNVLVDSAGVVKLLDFGVLSELSGHGADGEGVVAGTPGYLAPERIRGEAATAATDAYALGCMLFEILTGRRPFVGSTTTVLSGHLEETPPSASELAPVPPWLDELCRSLLAKDPAERPSLEEIRARVPAAGPARPVGIPRAIVGRDALNARLAALLESGERPLVLRGPSGVGKSALLDCLARAAAARGVPVLRSASRATERLAYNALDAAMDDLARLLMRRGDVVDRRTLRIAAEAFPVLRTRSRALDDARERVRQSLFGWREQLEACSRREVFDAVCRVFDSVAEAGPVLLLVDDLQWADRDSISLLSHVLERTSERVRVALVLRSDVEPGPAHEWLERLGAGAVVDVPPLDTADILTVIRRTALALGAEVDERSLLDAAAACDGRPFLAEVAGRSLARGAGGVLAELVAGAWARDGDLLALLAIADGWTPAKMLASLGGRTLGEIHDALLRLEERGLVRRSGAAHECVADLYHDGVRVAALARLAPAERVQLHGRIADCLLAAADPRAQRVVHHLVAAGRVAEAAAQARGAAAEAERQRAFGLAADMYAIALASGPPDAAALREARARALERSSRYAEAAAEWSELARDASGEERLELALHEAHALIAAGQTATGVRRLDLALAQIGRGSVRVRGAGTWLTAARFLLGPSARRSAGPVDPALKARAERDLKIGILLAFLDPFTGLSFLQRARRDFARGGARVQVAGCDYLMAVLALSGSRDPHRVPLAERWLASARENARGLDLPPDVRGMEPFVTGLVAMRQGRWAASHAGFEEAAEIFRESAGTTERTMALSFRMLMAAQRQDMPDLRARRDWFRRHAAERGGTLLFSHLAVVDAYIALLEGRFDEGADVLARAARSFTEEDANAQRAALRIYRFWADVYRDGAGAARRALAEEMKAAGRFRFLSTMFAGTYGALLSLVEANALRAGDRGASERRLERFAAITDRAPPFAAGASWRARAYAADARGRPDLALEHLVRAEHEAARFERGVDAAIARWQRGRRIGGVTGDSLCKEAVARVESIGVSPRVLEEDAGLR